MRFLALALLLASSTAFADYSNGFRMGELTKFSVKGLLLKSGEGQLSMGRDGAPYVIETKTKKGTTRRVVNPWYFSAETSQANEFQALAGEYVVVEYGQDGWKSMDKDTAYHALKVYKVLSDPLPQTTFAIHEPGGTKSEGFRVGRIVKASRKGSFVKTWEVLLQVGNSGNQYKNMSIDDERMYNFAIETLKRGKKVKVFYTEKSVFELGAQDTDYLIYKIEQANDLQ